MMSEISWLTQKRKKIKTPYFHKKIVCKILVMCPRLKKEVGFRFFLAVKWHTSTECQRRMQKKTGHFCVTETSVSHKSASLCSETLSFPVYLNCRAKQCILNICLTSWSSSPGIETGITGLTQEQGKVFVGEQCNREPESWDTFCWDLLTVGQPLKGIRNDLLVIFKGETPQFS